MRIITYPLEVPALTIDNDIQITYNPDTEIQSAVNQGFIKITTHFENTSTSSKTGELVVSRTTSKDNYVKREVISNPKVVLNTGSFDYIVVDRLVESGVGYKYTVYFKNENNTVSNSIQTVNPIYCTKIASKLTRPKAKKHSLKNLCEDMLGIQIDKEQQCSDWTKDELSPEQIQYAAGDVMYLHALKAKLDKLLKEQNKEELAASCFAFLPTRAELDLMGLDEPDLFSHH